MRDNRRLGRIKEIVSVWKKWCNNSLKPKFRELNRFSSTGEKTENEKPCTHLRQVNKASNIALSDVTYHRNNFVLASVAVTSYRDISVFYGIFSTLLCIGLLNVRILK
jgi:hypothetical protein